MNVRRALRPAVAPALFALGVALAGCQSGDEAARTNTVYPLETRPLDAEGAVIPERAAATVQLAHAPGVRHAGLYAAEARGFFEDVKLDVTLISGGTEVEPAQVVASERAELGIDTLPELLAARDEGIDVVSVAQVFARSGRVLEDARTGMPADGIFAAAEWLQNPDNRDLAVRFLQASFLGWVFCRDYPEECAQILHQEVPAVDESLQLAQLHEVNALIWPNETGIGTMAPATFRRASRSAQRLGLIERPATTDAWRDDLALLAVTEGQDEEDPRTTQHYDLLGLYWEKPTVDRG
jgi:ABC-type nitrate/sulfonate/bicarbonate transport system substrate-binding protein